ncbi:MAG: hypothetical protein Q9184_002481 [Pyrenodesmia sp. 2 TL-2023]
MRGFQKAMGGFTLDLVRGELPYKFGKKPHKPPFRGPPPTPAIRRSSLARDATMRNRRESAAKIERENAKAENRARGASDASGFSIQRMASRVVTRVSSRKQEPTMTQTMRNHQQLGHSVYVVAEEILSRHNSVDNLPAATKTEERPKSMARANSAAILTPTAAAAAAAAAHPASLVGGVAKEGELRLSKSESQLKGGQPRDSGLGSSTRTCMRASQDTGKRANPGSKRNSTASSKYSQSQRAELVTPCMQDGDGGDDEGIEMVEMVPAAAVA